MFLPVQVKCNVKLNAVFSLFAHAEMKRFIFARVIGLLDENLKVKPTMR